MALGEVTLPILVGGQWPLGSLPPFWDSYSFFGDSCLLLGTVTTILRMVIPISGPLPLFWGWLSPFRDSYSPFGAGYPHLGTVIPALGWLSLFWGQLCPF